jgi:hypothetical protein
MVSKNVAINIGIANLFTDADVQSDYISRVLATAGGAFDVLMGSFFGLKHLLM